MEYLSPKKEDPWALVRKLEAQLAQEKFYHDKTKTENQYEIKVKQLTCCQVLGTATVTKL